MVGNRARFVARVAVIFASVVMTGCSSSPQLPANARLIWSGTVDGPGYKWRDIAPAATGQIYAVDHNTGEIKAVDSVWSGKPTFTLDLRPGRHYDLYLAESDAGAATSRPVK